MIDQNYKTQTDLFQQMQYLKEQEHYVINAIHRNLNEHIPNATALHISDIPLHHSIPILYKEHLSYRE